MKIEHSLKYLEARDSLPDELKTIFDDCVSHYKYAATIRYGRPYVSYVVLADMIKAGWRLSAEPIKETKPSKS